jgi:hypothetical protein
MASGCARRGIRAGGRDWLHMHGFIHFPSGNNSLCTAIKGIFFKCTNAKINLNVAFPKKKCGWYCECAPA